MGANEPDELDILDDDGALNPTNEITVVTHAYRHFLKYSGHTVLDSISSLCLYVLDPSGD